MKTRANIKEGDYITILSPMITKLKLNGNNLLVFALIHGFSKDGEHYFTGSLNYICDWLNISRGAVIEVLKVLTKYNLITKEDNIVNGIRFCKYKSNYDDIIEQINDGAEIKPIVKKKTRGSTETELVGTETEPNIIDYNIKSIDGKEIEDKSTIKKSGIDYDYIMQQWHEICSMLPAIRDINDKRKKNIANTLRNNKATVDDLIKCFRIMSVSSFCRGEGSKNWIATFDWLISDTKSCFNRILEGEFNKKPYEHKFYEDIMQDKEIDNDNNNTINLNGVTYR